jgi:hypothetical protein
MATDKIRFCGNTVATVYRWEEYDHHPQRFDRERWLADKVLGDPQPTAAYTVAQLKAMGYVGVYWIGSTDSPEEHPEWFVDRSTSGIDPVPKESTDV